MNAIKNMSMLMRGLLMLVLAAGMLSAAQAAETVEYIHTDALGSPVAVTDANGVVIERTVYEPYGAVVGWQVKDGPGYTGHVSDSATGLSYMQQRYMDPEVGAFLSIDPVQAYEKPFEQFGRYRYGNGNPYSFKDPDGRSAAALPLLVIPMIVVTTIVAMPAEQRADLGNAIQRSFNKMLQGAEPPDSGPALQGDGSLSPDKAQRGDRSGKSFTPKGRAEVKAKNAEKYGGQTTCEGCKTSTVPAEKSVKGVSPPANETQVDHVIPKAKGGAGDPSNGQVLCRACNRNKSDNL